MSNKETKVYSEPEINEMLKKLLKGWEFDGKWIRKTYKTHSWKSTLMVVNTIGHLAEVAWHHPDLVVSYAFVEVKLMMWYPKDSSNSLEGTPSDARFAYIKYDK